MSLVFLLFFYPIPHRPLLFATPESLLGLASPLPLLTPNLSHQHLVTQQVALVTGLHLHRHLPPVQGYPAVELCPWLVVGVIGQVERLAVCLLAEHVRSIWFLQCWGEGEWSRGEGEGGAPGLVRLAGGLGGEAQACLIVPGGTSCIAMCSLWNVL